MYEDDRVSPGRVSGSLSSGASEHSYNKRRGRGYSLSPRSRSRSPIGKGSLCLLI